MRINHLFFRSFAAALMLLSFGLFYSADAQMNGAASPSDGAGQQEVRPTVVLPTQLSPQHVAGSSDLMCGGFIQYAPAPNGIQIVGGEEEQEQRVYSSGDYVYINVGSHDGVRVGQEYLAVRPRGQFKSKFSKKKGWLGVFTQEIGTLRVLTVKEYVSVAMVTSSCDTLLLGDLLRAKPQRVAPLSKAEGNIDRFADPSGKPNGRIILSRDAREMPTKDQIVFIDLGSEDNVRPGDALTIYRRLGRGNVTRFRDEEVAKAASSGFESDVFKGGRFSNQAQRVKDANGNGIYGPIVSSPGIKSDRPKMPRKIVGEMVILSVQQRTATAVITRIAQEVHTGDYVEVQ